MAQTSRLGIADSQLGNILLAFAGDAPSWPSTDDMSGRLAVPAAILGNVLLGVGGPDGPMVVHLWAESVLALEQTGDGEAEIVGHIPPAWVMGSPDWQLGDCQLGFVGADDPLPALGARSGRLGVGLGSLVLAIAGAAGANVINVSATSGLELVDSAICDAEIAPHAPPRWALGSIDSPVGKMQLAYVEKAPQPPTGTMTGGLGAVASLLGNMRAALGEEEGGGGATIIYASAMSALTVSGQAAVGVARGGAASSAIALTDAAGVGCSLGRAADNALVLTDSAAADAVRSVAGSDALDLADATSVAVVFAAVAGSAADLTVAADTTAVRTLAVTDSLELTDGADRTALLALGAESVVEPVAAVDAAAVRAVAAESALDLVDEADSTGRTVWTLAVESPISLSSTLAVGLTLGLEVAQSLDLADLAGQNAVRTLDAQSVVNPSGAASAAAVRPVTATDSLVVTGAATAQKILAVAIESAISLESAASATVTRTVSAASTLDLLDGATGGKLIEVEVWDWLPLWDWAEVAVVRSVAAANTITLSHAEQTGRPWYLSAETPIQTVSYQYDQATDTFYLVYEGLQDSASTARPLTATVQQSIPLAQSASAVLVRPNAVSVSAESILDLLGRIRLNPTGEAGNWLTLGQSAAVDKCKLVKTTLSLADEAAVLVSVGREAASALGLSQAATYSIVSRGVLDQYHPFVGEGSGPTPPAVTIGPPEHVALPFQLFYPAEGIVTDSVVLRAPNLGNKDRLSFNRILRETRGGTLIVFADPIWPKIQTLVLTFSGLRSVQAQRLLAFLETHLGEEIGLLDWEGRAWKGIITTPTDPVVQDGKDSFSASMEFEGELVPA
jgi:hypothetical protein